jgi:general secretion pathway protein D
VGTEANVTFRGGSPRVESEVEGPFDEGGEGEGEDIRELIQRRIQQLPRGLREQQGEEGKEPEEPSGVELVPGTPPGTAFPNPEEEPPPEEPPPFGFPSDAEPPPGGVFGGGTASQTLRLAGYEPPVLLAASRPQAVELRLAPRRLVVAPGDEFELALQVAAGKPVAHLPVRLAFDPALLAVEAVADGEFLGPAGEAEVLADFSRPGELVLGASRLGRSAGVGGTGTVARIRFRALALGTATVEFAQAEALAADLAPVVPVAAAAATVEVEEPVGPGRPGRPPRQET